MKTSQPVSPVGSTSAPILLAFLASCFTLNGAELRYTIAPDTENQQLGATTIAVGDLTADGIPEIAVADRSCKVGDSFFGSGCVYLLDGADGSIIREFTGEPARNQNFGFALATLNADGDDFPDLAIGASGHSGSSGMVWIYSGSDGSLISNVLGPAASLYGSALANAGDFNGDGLDELWVGAPNSNAAHGSLLLQSSIDGSTISEYLGDASQSGFASQIATLGDIDGDNIPDLAIASPNFRDPSGPRLGRVQVFRSSDQQAVATLMGSAHYELLGYSLATVPDANADDQPDLLIGSYHGGTCLLCSGTDLSVIEDLSIPNVVSYQPTAAGGGFDADGDGVSDWLLGSSGLTGDGINVFGGVKILSGSDRSILFEHGSTVSRSGLGASLTVLDGFGVAMGESMRQDPETMGFGHVQIWEFEQFGETEPEEPDSDGDGVPDAVDRVPDSNMDSTVLIFGVDSGVENRADAKGVTLADRLSKIKEPKNRQQAFSRFFRVVVSIYQLQRRDLISEDEANALFQIAFRGAFRP